MAKRVKTREEVEAKMRERIGTAGKYLQEALEKAEDPLDVLLKDPDAFAKKLAENLAEAIRTGKFASGLKKAKERNAWKNATERAGRHYEERTDDIVEHALSNYDERRKCIEEARKAIENMPTRTREDRIKRSAEYQRRVAECFDRVFGRKK
ncbi:MAG: hypothetical protein ACXQTD_07415 [Candidatus Syntropharchaeia archaeon]